MARLRLRLALIALLFGLPACSGPSAPSPSPDGPASAAPVVTSPSEVASAIVDLTNSERTQAGLAPLRLNTRLLQAAQLQADQVSQLQVLDHDLPGTRYPTPPDRLAAAAYQWQAWGENLAMGQRNAAAAVTAWMESPGHRANILNANFTEIGAAYATDTQGRPYYVQVFGHPR